MITLQSNAEKYSALYEEAWNALSPEDREDYPDGFACLEQYFTKIGSLAMKHAENVDAVKKQPNRTEDNVKFKSYSKFLMLPIEEEYFIINANSRTIDIPNSYAKNGVSVVGDQIAETLLFEIDRYFDYTDLTRKTIYIQWTNPAGKEGATWITMVDFDDKKIRFGWPLDKRVTTEGNGKLQFSVRFFSKDGEDLSYSLNTLPATVSIKNTLYAELNDSIEIDEPSSYFVNAIVNGSDSKATIKPGDAVPVNGYVFPAEVYLNETYDKCVAADGTLHAQGYANDSGKLSYAWYHKGYEDSSSQIIKALQRPETYLVTDDKTRQPQKRYYIAVGEDDYSIYSGDDFSQVLYEAVSEYKLPTESSVVGYYTIEMQNKIGANTTTTVSKFEIPGPKSIVLSDLPENGTILADDTKLSISATQDNDKAVLSYEWQYKNREDGEFAPITDSNVSELALSGKEPGWYRVKATSVLNRAELSKVSEQAARVTNLPATPNIIDYSDEGYIIVNTEGDGKARLTVEIENLNPNGVDNKLVSDKVHYIWKRQVIDSEETITISHDYEGVYSLNDNTLIVDVKSLDNATDSRAAFFCEVYNELNGKNSAIVNTERYVIVNM